MKPTFSILHATYGRPEKAVAAALNWMHRAEFPRRVEYIFALNYDDPTANKLQPLIEAHALEFALFARVDFVQGDFHGSAPAWDKAASISTGDILIQGQDDVEPPLNWDARLEHTAERAKAHSEDDRPFFIAVSDGYRKDDLCCTAIMSRQYYELEGFFLCPEYLSVFSDDEVTYRALRNARDGKAEYIKTNLVFLHRHHYHDKAVPFDETYARENSATAYRVGQHLFWQRNPKAATDGLRTWT